MQEMQEEARLPICLALADRYFALRLPSAERSPHLEAVFEEYHGAYYRYHEVLPPVPDCNPAAPGFAKADPKRTVEAIVQELTPVCGKARKPGKYIRGFTLCFGDWSLSTYARVRPADQMAFCCSFLRRSDAPIDWDETWVVQHHSSRLDPIMFLGVADTCFPLVSQPHEALCAQSLRVSMSMFVPAVPKLVESLGVAD
jgi:hypothetical protein